MNTTNGWPDSARPGVPLNPEVDGWHWVSLLGSDHPQIMEWFSDAMVWADDWTVEACAMHLRYLGPCLTPDEEQNLRDDLASAERERAHQHGRADRSAAEHAREQAKREALQKRVAELEGALRFYADPFKYTDIHGDDVRVPHFYSETDFGETARVALGLDEPWSLQP